MNKKIFSVAVLVLALDQLSKVIVGMKLSVNQSITIIPNFFNLTLCHNEGAAWGIFSNNQVIIFIGTILAIAIIYHFIYCFKSNKRNDIAFGLVIGGMSGNLIDRIFFGYVRDFLDFKLFSYDYPVFNFSDIAIVIGIILLIYAIIKGEDLSENSSRSRKSKTR